MLTLVKTDLHPDVQQRVIRMQQDVRRLSEMSGPEVRAVYHELEWVRDEFSKLLDRADAKRL
jgi:hypothetical protein